MYEYEFFADLYRFKLSDFGVISGMDLLAKHQAQIDCPSKKLPCGDPTGIR